MAVSSDRSSVATERGHSEHQGRSMGNDKQHNREQHNISTPSRTKSMEDSNPKSKTLDKVDARSLPCENRQHSFHQGWTGEECDHESFFCFSVGVNDNCCKCRPECCGLCNTISSYNDPYQACPMLSSRAHDERVSADGEMSTLNTLLVGMSIAFIVGTILGCMVVLIRGNYQECKRMSKLILNDRSKENISPRREDDQDDFLNYSERKTFCSFNSSRSSGGSSTAGSSSSGRSRLTVPLSSPPRRSGSGSSAMSSLSSAPTPSHSPTRLEPKDVMELPGSPAVVDEDKEKRLAEEKRKREEFKASRLKALEERAGGVGSK